jgi:hypothetical protein
MEKSPVEGFTLDELTRKTSIEELKDEELNEQEVLLKNISDLSSKKRPGQKRSKKTERP